MKIGAVDLPSPFAIAPMAGMTDTAFRRLVKRHGGCGLVVTEMVSSEGLVRGIDRTLEYAEYTEEERPISIQIFGGDPDKMAAAAQIVEGMGADIVDVNMGCPVPKIAKHNAGCSLMREPAHAAAVIGGDGEGREDSGDGEDARRLERRRAERADAGAGWSRTPAPRRLPSTAARRRRATADRPTGIWWRRSPTSWPFPVFGSGDCIEPRADRRPRCGRALEGVLVGRGVLRNPWILAQAADLAAGRPAARGHARGSRPLPARLHRSAAARARRRSPRAHPRSLGDQQDARAWRRGTRKASTTDRTCGPPSTAPIRCPRCATRSGRFSSPASPPHSSPVSFRTHVSCR